MQGKIFSFYLYPKHNGKIQKWASQMGMNTSEVLRKLIDEVELVEQEKKVSVPSFSLSQSVEDSEGEAHE